MAFWDLKVGEEEEEEIKWIPRITISDLKHNGMRVHFDPPYPGAASHHICALKGLFKCVNGVFKVMMPSVSQFIEIPNNATYRVLVRPYDRHGEDLYLWMPAPLPIFLPPFETEVSTLNIPVETPIYGKNVTEKTNTPGFFSHPLNIALVATVSILAVIFLILATIASRFVKRRKKRYAFNEGLCEFENPSENLPVTIIPIYLYDLTGMVEAHLDILKNQPGMIIERARADLLHGDIENWISTHINSVLQRQNNFFLIYASDVLKRTFENPDLVHERQEDQLCVKVLEKLKTRNVKPFVVCFGDQTYLDNYQPLTLFSHYSIIPVVKYKHDRSVSFDGTLDLIRQLLSIDVASQVSLDSTDTRHLQDLFLHHHSVVF